MWNYMLLSSLWAFNNGLPLVYDDPKLPDDSGEIPKSQGRGWRFDSWLWNLLSTWRKTCHVVNCLLCFDVGMSAFCLKQKKQLLAHLPSSWLVSQATSLSQHLAKQGANTLHKTTTMWKASWNLSHWETHANPTSKIVFDDIKEAFLAKEWICF